MQVEEGANPHVYSLRDPTRITSRTTVLHPPGGSIKVTFERCVLILTYVTFEIPTTAP